MTRWRLLHSDDEEGILEAEATTLVLRLRDRVHIDVGLDENAQTRVDVRISAKKGWADLGRGRRTTGRFFRRLDASTNAGPAQILDTTRSPSWSA